MAQALEWRWWKRYLRSKDPDVYLGEKAAYWRRLLRELNWPVEAETRSADLGCGPAGVFTVIHEAQRVTALDPLLRRYDELPVFDRNRYPGVRFVECSLEEADQLGTFDQLYCINAINHVKDWDAALDALTRLARPGTRLLLTSDVHHRPWLRPLFRALPGDILHPQQHDAEAYRMALRQRGWHIVREKLLRKQSIFEYRAWVCLLS